METVPVREGKSCVFRVVRVSGTMRKTQEEAIRRAREMILKARQEESEKGNGAGDKTLEGIFGKRAEEAARSAAREVMMVDASDGEEEEEVSEG